MIWEYYFALSPSLCLRRFLAVLLNTVTTTTIGILQKTRSFPRCLNPICSLFVCLIKASKNGWASFSVSLITYLGDGDDMRTGRREKEAGVARDSRDAKMRGDPTRPLGLGGVGRTPVFAAHLSAEKLITCLLPMCKADWSMPNIREQRLTVRKQTYEEIQQQSNDLSFHLGLRQWGEIKRRGEREQTAGGRQSGITWYELDRYVLLMSSYTGVPKWP